MEQNNILYWYWLSKKEEIGNKTIDQLLMCFGSIEGVFRAEKKELIKVNGLSEKKIVHLLTDRNEELLNEEYQHMKKKGIRLVLRMEEDYPEKLRNIFDPPWYLYVKGNLPQFGIPAIAVIGARNCSYYGKEVARTFSKHLAEAGIQIISGLAKGIDGYAHEGAIKGGGRTYGVLGNGVDIYYPYQNAHLYNLVEEKGGLITEYAPGINALPFHFPLRNRIISGLSDGILVIEAREKSGTLITVEYGLEQGRDIYAIPGKIEDRLSVGCNRLIQQGAKLVQEPEDILEDFKYRTFTCWSVQKSNKTSDRKEISGQLTEGERKVYEVLSTEPKHTEQITIETGMLAGVVLESLVSLEIKRVIQKVSSNHYIKILS